ncbi:hypothetical protein [uncultured Corynebacterium sp.]|uniref:hypothetical protein n=1 Tax=uncultured Corynebacterium sp. TaxID=159447 RepID=UPI0025FE7F6D|nr:hypothetical protein [uncultured Corynebacterium sp.]
MSNNSWNNWNPNYPAQQAPRPQQNKTSPWVYSIVAISVVALLVAGVLTATAVMGKDGGDGEESPVAAETTASERQETKTKTSEAEPTSETPEEGPTPEEPRDSGSSSPEYRLSSYGWEGSPAHCNADDQWLYAAYGDGDYVVVCKVGEYGDYYYRSYVGGHSIEKDVDMSYADPSRGSYSVPVGGGTRIEINQRDLQVYEHGEVASNVKFDQFFVADR